jgi:hypothetical protein
MPGDRLGGGNRCKGMRGHGSAGAVKEVSWSIPSLVLRKRHEEGGISM